MKKKKRPISRNFWNLLRYLPKSLRAKIVRSRFDADYNLPEDLVLKQAETADEIAQALQIVHNSYVELGYIEPQESRMRFNKFLALPTTVFLIAKYKNQVIGTMSIICDSALGLPSESAWNFKQLRSSGKLLAEISSLSILPNFKMRRGRLLLPLCKLMYEYASKILQIDTLIISTTYEVEAFYTDILLFNRLSLKSGESHPMVNGNNSTCCYLHLGEENNQNYKEVYGKMAKHRNLHHFFIEYKCPQIHLPERKKSIHGYLNEKNLSLERLINQHQDLTKDFQGPDFFIIDNLKVDKDAKHYDIPKHGGPRHRITIREKAWAIFSGCDPIQSRVLDISDFGFKLQLTNLSDDSLNLIQVNDVLALAILLPEGPLVIKAKVQWNKNQRWIGCCLVGQPSEEWAQYVAQIWEELGRVMPHKRLKKVA